MCKAEEEQFKDVADLISEATKKSGEEQQCQAIRDYDGDDAVAVPYLISEAKVEMFWGVVNADLLSDDTEESGEEHHCQAVRLCDVDDKKADLIRDAMMDINNVFAEEVKEAQANINPS